MRNSSKSTSDLRKILESTEWSQTHRPICVRLHGDGKRVIYYLTISVVETLAHRRQEVHALEARRQALDLTSGALESLPGSATQT